MKKHFHYSFFICLACTLTLFVCTGLACNLFSIYMPFILKDYGITNTQSSSILLIRSFSSFLAISVSGFYYKLFNLRKGMLTAALISALGFVIYSRANGYPLMIAGSALTGIGFGIGATLPVSMLLNRWFFKYRNLAMSISAVGTTLATIGVPSLVTASVNTLGLRSTFLMQSAVMAAIALLCFMIIRDDPSSMSLKRFGEAETSGDQDAPADGNETKGNDKKDSPENTSRTKGFSLNFHGYVRKSDWLILIPTLFFIGVLANPAYNHMSVLFSGQGFDPSAIALALSASGLAGTAGKLLFGWLSDKISVFVCNFIYGMLMTAGLILMCTASSMSIMYLSVAVFSFGVGITVIGPTAWAGDLSSEDQFDSVIRRFQQLYNLGSIVFTLFPGMVADRCGGSYVPAYVVFIIFSFFAVAAIQYMYVLNIKRDRRD